MLEQIERKAYTMVSGKITSWVFPLNSSVAQS
jgi:hypothetical protein